MAQIKIHERKQRLRGMGGYPPENNNIHKWQVTREWGVIPEETITECILNLII